MKVDLLLTGDGRRQFYGEVQESLGEADPPHQGLRGWLERERERLATLWRHDDSRVMRALHRIWDWLNRWTDPDEVWLIRLRSAAAIEVRHPTTLTAADASLAWAEFLEGRKRRHLAWLVFYAATCPLTLLLVPLPGPNLIGYWCAYRAIRHLMVVLGLFRAGRGRVPTTFGPSEALDRPPGNGRATREDLMCEIHGLSRQAQTPGARELVCTAGEVDRVAETADMVLRQADRPSGLGVDRRADQRGGRPRHRPADVETFGASQPGSWHKDTEGKTCAFVSLAYVSLDLTDLRMQGSDGAAAEGRMAAVGMASNPMPDDPTRWARPQRPTPQPQARYVAGLEGQASFAEPLRKQAAQVGMDQAERWLALSDAGAGVEDLLRVNFGRVEAVILDFYHAAKHLGDLGRALSPAMS